MSAISLLMPMAVHGMEHHLLQPGLWKLAFITPAAGRSNLSPWVGISCQNQCRHFWPRASHWKSVYES